MLSEVIMKRHAALAVGILFTVCACGSLVAAQSSGTVNPLSSDPQQNQKLSGNMGTTTGQPNSVTPGSRNNPDGGNPAGQGQASPYEQSQQESRDAQYSSAQPAGEGTGNNASNQKKKPETQASPSTTETGNAPNQTPPRP